MRSMFFNHNNIKLENNRRKYGKYTNYFELYENEPQHSNLLEAAKGVLEGEGAAEMPVLEKKKALESVI